MLGLGGFSAWLHDITIYNCQYLCDFYLNIAFDIEFVTCIDVVGIPFIVFFYVSTILQQSQAGF